ncbi:MAG: 50S ribosomal protein L11 methyltransferase [Alphaproteobacteria bacterium]|nr:50S ribosomal protein L11 methyltransferase [Alphaproteobacteria bacterium]
MSQMSQCLQITFEERQEVDPLFADFLEVCFEVVSCNYTEAGNEQYVAYAELGFDEKAFVEVAKEQGIELLPYTIELLESQNWLKDNVIEFAPVELEDFLIYGIHEKEQPQTDKIPIKIYAATAFGSEHQTTKACLQAIGKLKKLGVKTDKILDMGCGSGILAIACAKIWHEKSKIFAVDIDEEAVWVTRQNAVDNGVGKIVSAEVSNGYAASFVTENGEYDVIIANILARPLIEMAKDLYENLKTGGYCILSGFVEDQVEWVVQAHQEQGLKLLDVYEIDNWRAALMEKI